MGHIGQLLYSFVRYVSEWDIFVRNTKLTPDGMEYLKYMINEGRKMKTEVWARVATANYLGILLPLSPPYHHTHSTEDCKNEIKKVSEKFTRRIEEVQEMVDAYYQDNSPF